MHNTRYECPSGEELAAYYKVRKYFSQGDVIGHLEDEGIKIVSEWALRSAVEALDSWKGSNECWGGAVAEIVSELTARPAGMLGLGFVGELQQFDLNDNRCDLWETDFEIPDSVAASLSAKQLQNLLDEPRWDGNTGTGTTLELLCHQAYELGLLADGASWTWEDPCDIRVACDDDVRAYLTWKRRENEGIG